MLSPPVESELVEQGYLSCERRGARNHYEVQTDRPLDNPLLSECGLEELLAVLATDKELLGARRENGGAPARAH